MTAQLCPFKQTKITLLIDTLLHHPCRKNIEKIIGILLWATSLVHHVRFLLTSLYRDLYALPATNYSISGNISSLSSMTVPQSLSKTPSTFQWEDTWSNSSVHLLMRQATCLGLRAPNCDKRKLSDSSRDALYDGPSTHFYHFSLPYHSTGQQT